MTDERKPPETPGMAEVSAAFAHEAEAAAGTPAPSASMPDDPLVTMRAERQGLTAELAATPEGEDAALWPRLEDVETRILTAEPQTLLGALAQIEVLASMVDEGVPDFAAEVVAQLNERAPTRIKGLLASAIEDPVLVLKREWEARYQLLDEHRDDPDADDSDEALDPFYDRLRETECQILHTRATTPAGIAVKLVLWARLRPEAGGTSGLDWNNEPIEGKSFDLDYLPVVSALNDLERMARTTTVVETPPAEDAALFDALAEYDRLAAIEKELNRRTEIFRPGIPAAEEATRAHEAACDEAMKAFERTRKIPATTMAGLFARMQATELYMTDLEEASIYEEDWRVIKADVQRIAGEVRS